jgi:hypothetical protein
MTNTDRTLEKLASLLAKAEATEFEYERDALMEAAQRISTLYSIDLATARSRADNRSKNATPIKREVRIGERGKRGLGNYCNLIIGISRANNLKITLARNNTHVWLWGFEEDIELTLRLYGSLLQQMIEASEAWLDTGEYKTDVVRREVTKSDIKLDWDDEPVIDYRTGKPKRTYWTEWADVPIPKVTARTNFQQAFAYRVEDRLTWAARDAEREAKAADVIAGDGTITSSGTELVLFEKRKEVEEFFMKNCDARGSWKGGRKSAHSHAATAAGRQAGDSARLSSPGEFNGGRRAIS